MTQINPAQGQTAALSTARAAAAPHIAAAARETGADFDFLVRTAARESNFDPNAQARTSSAAGMFQFIDQTWLGVMHRHGAAHGYGDLASAISRDDNGRFQVSAEKRDAVLDLRFDPSAASLMAGELAAENASVIQSRLGREPSSGELYAAHFLGAGGAAQLIEAVENEPGARADQLFPAAASANRPIFYEGGYEGGRARSASEVLAVLTGEAEANRPVQPAPPSGEGGRAAMNQAAAAAVIGSSAGVAPRLTGELSPEVVEILASLDAPERGGREKSRDA